MANEMMIEEGWRHVKAGVALITWSKLAHWNSQNLRLMASKQSDFESAEAGHKQIHPEFGRLICWITFGVGAEYLGKGVCILNNKPPKGGQPKVLRPPELGDDIENWIKLVNDKVRVQREQKSGSRLYEPVTSLGTLNEVQKQLLAVVKEAEKRDRVWASFELLRDSIRNRDAHRYTENVRKFHFHAVERLFVPAFNILIEYLDQEELQSRASASPASRL